MVRRSSLAWIIPCALFASTTPSAAEDPKTPPPPAKAPAAPGTTPSDAKKPAEAKAAAVKIGDKVADFELKDPSGKAHSLKQALKGNKAVVLDFWSSRCPVSLKYEPVLKKLAGDYGPKKIVFLAIDSNFNEPADEIQKIGTERAINFPVLLDGADAKMATYFGASKTPEAFVIAADGKLVYHGNLDEISPALDAVLAKKPVPKAETKAFGCSIKRP
jgi:thiol-disulfide isomerase/thioredoxin